MINSALILAETANNEKHNQSHVNVKLLAPLKRSPKSLIEAYSNEAPIGDLKRFNDIFHAILSPTHHEDVKNFFADCTKVVEAGQSKIKSFIQEIDR